MKIAITGASGKTGYRISEEAVKKGYKVRQIIRKNSKVSAGLERLETVRVSLDKKGELDEALKDIDALIIATGARASLDLTGPAKVDALGVYRQLESCKRVGIKRVILVSSLCTGKLFHPLNLFGLILIWKKLGENFLRNSNFEWTIIRPGGLKENEDIKSENINYSKEDTQLMLTDLRTRNEPIRHKAAFKGCQPEFQSLVSRLIKQLEDELVAEKLTNRDS